MYKGCQKYNAMQEALILSRVRFAAHNILQYLAIGPSCSPCHSPCPPRRNKDQSKKGEARSSPSGTQSGGSHTLSHGTVMRSEQPARKVNT